MLGQEDSFAQWDDVSVKIVWRKKNKVAKVRKKRGYVAPNGLSCISPELLYMAKVRIENHVKFVEPIRVYRIEHILYVKFFPYFKFLLSLLNIYMQKSPNLFIFCPNIFIYYQNDKNQEINKSLIIIQSVNKEPTNVSSFNLYKSPKFQLSLTN